MVLILPQRLLLLLVLAVRVVCVVQVNIAGRGVHVKTPSIRVMAMENNFAEDMAQKLTRKRTKCTKKISKVLV